MAEKLGVQEIVSAIESLTVLELAELIQELKEKFGVSGTMPVAVTAGPVPGTATEEQKEEKTSFDVILESVPADTKIKVLKEVRTVTGLGLKEAKALIDGLPKPVKEGVDKEEAEKIKEKLESLGAKVTLK